MSLTSSIILTLAYSAQFGQPLNQLAIYRRLIYKGKQLVSPNQINRCLNLLAKQKLIIGQNNFYTLQGFGKNFQNQHQKYQQSQTYWQEIPKIVWFLKKINWITGVAVTGSLAVNNSQTKDDIDLLVITQAQRLWLTRILVTAYALALGKKKARGITQGPGWCFNLWLSEDQLAMPAAKRSVYTAFELTQAVWLLASKQTLKKVLSANRWLLALTPNNQLNLTRIEFLPLKKFNPLFKPLSLILNKINAWVYSWQKIYMSRHQTREIVNKNVAFFHPLDTKTKIYKNWRKTLQQWEKIVLKEER